MLSGGISRGWVAVQQLPHRESHDHEPRIREREGGREGGRGREGEGERERESERERERERPTTILFSAARLARDRLRALRSTG